MRFRVLGPLEVWDDARRVALGGPQQRALLAVLLLDANRVVSVDRLVASLWGEEPPATARRLLHGCVAQLRRALRSDHDGAVRQPLVTRPPGYMVETRPGELDLDRFAELDVQAGRSLAEGSRVALRRAVGLLDEALALWRGPALGDVDLEACRTAATRLEERRLAVIERRVDLELRLGRHAELVGELQAQARAHPLRERPWAQLMVALHGAQRQADALAAYRELRETLVEQLGVEPSEMLRQLERAVLAGADVLEMYQRQLHMPVGGPRAETERDEPEPAAGAEEEQDTAAAAVAAVPAQLPAAVSSFTGRAEQLDRLDALLAGDDTGRATAVVISAIAGTAGVGKTALAVQWAQRVRDRFPDGQLHVDLRGYAPAPPLRPLEALAGFLRALGVPAQQVPADQEQAAGLYRSLLAGRRMLVVLDNARTVEQVRPLLPGSPGCLVLVTSRDRLGGLVARDGAHHLAVDVLDPDEATALLGHVLGRERVTAEPAAAAELARLCAFLPLALRIAAANLALNPGHSIAEHVAELAAGNRLASLEVGGDEQAAMRAAFDLSYATLAPEARRMFRLLGLVPGPDVTAEAAAALTGTTPEEAGQLLARLADAHLLTRHAPARYAFHDLLRLYAAERARDEEAVDERDTAIRRLLNWYLQTAGAAAKVLHPDQARLPLPDADPGAPSAGFDDAHALAWLDAELANLVAAARHAADRGPRPAAWLLADTLRGYYWLRGYTLDSLTLAHAGLAAAEADGDLRGQAASQLALANAHLHLAEHPLAVERFERALALFRETGWLQGQAACLSNLGILLRKLGRLEEAADHHRQALAIDRQSGWLAGQAVRLYNLSQVLQELGRLEEAADHHRQALAIDRQTGSRRGEAMDLLILGETCDLLGRLDQALDHLGRALALLRETGDRRNEAECLGLLAATHRDAGRYDLALDLARAGVALARDTADRLVEGGTLNTLASVRQCLGRHAQAIDDYHQALRIAHQVEVSNVELLAKIGLAATHQQLTQLDEAHLLAGQAVRLARQRGFRVLEGQALAVLAAVELDLGRPGQAAEHARQALALHQATGHRVGEARTLLLLSRLPRGAGHDGDAAGHLRRAFALFSEIGAPEADQARSRLLEIGEATPDSGAPVVG